MGFSRGWFSNRCLKFPPRGTCLCIQNDFMDQNLDASMGSEWAKEPEFQMFSNK